MFMSCAAWMAEVRHVARARVVRTAHFTRPAVLPLWAVAISRAVHNDTDSRRAKHQNTQKGQSVTGRKRATSVVPTRGDNMGDKGGKKDKEKNKQQQVKK